MIHLMKSSGAWCAAAGALLAASLAQAEEPPRYRLQVGQKIEYKSVAQSKAAQGGGYTYGNDWTLWVVGRNDDGSWRLIGQCASRFSQSEFNDNAPADVQLVWFDLHPDGRIPTNSTIAFRANPSGLFIALPDKPATKGLQYTAHRPQDDAVLRHTVLETGPSLVIELTAESLQDEIYEIRQTEQVQFDPGRGLVTGSEGSLSQGYGFKSTGTSRTELKSVGTVPAEQIERLRTGSEQYFKAQDEYSALMKRINTEPQKAQALAGEARKVLQSAHQQAQDPVIKDQLQKALGQVDQYAQYSVEQAQRLATVLDKPAADWELKDLAGRAHKLADYRGKVVVLDFWYRGCGWCIKAMPQIVRVADHFKDKPVVILGMNTDRNLDDARFVEQKMKLNYANLQAIGIPEKYGVRGFPTLIIIDPQGVVRHVEVGYSPTLYDEVCARIQALLGEKVSSAGR
jgi:thiol-disulfide isomerase/thioredoxin